MGKGEIARNEQFLLFPQCFLLIWCTFCNFGQIRNFCLQTLSVWKSLKLLCGKGLKTFSVRVPRGWDYMVKSRDKYIVPYKNDESLMYGKIFYVCTTEISYE